MSINNTFISVCDEQKVVRSLVMSLVQTKASSAAVILAAASDDAAAQRKFAVTATESSSSITKAQLSNAIWVNWEHAKIEAVKRYGDAGDSAAAHRRFGVPFWRSSWAGESMGISNLNIDGLRVMFPYDAIYPEQVQYMHYLKQALDASHGQGLIEMPTGTGKTVTIMSLVTSYQLEHPEMGKLVYCTRTVPEMNQAIRELKLVIEYRDRILAGEKPDEPPKRFLGIGLSARRNMCIHPDVAGQADRDKIDIMCREMTSNFIKKSSSSSSSSAGRCSFFEQYDELIGGVGSRYNNDIESSANGQKKKFAIPSGVYTLEDLRVAGGAEGWCPYYMTKRLLRHADVIVFNY
ncbi:General transcription and DNA repair factor IIH helicase subunit XPD, partial [Perkinsus olseni]